MHVLDVVTLSPSSPSAPLSYRSKEKLAPGTIVSILLRKTPVHGIVVGCTEVRDAKFMLKSASFALAKSVRRTDGTLPKALFNVAEHVARYHAVPLGSVLHALFSDSMALDIPRTLPDGDGYQLRTHEFPRRVRTNKYRKIIEENLKDRKATVLTLPTIAELNEFKELFKDLKPIVLSGEVKPEPRKLLLNEAAESRGLILTTPAYSFTAVRELGAIIIERPSAGTYRMPSRPFLDRTVALLALAKERAIPIHLGDYPLPLEYRTRMEEGLFNTPSGAVEAVDVRTVREQGEVWKAIPDSSLEEMRKVHKDGGRMLVLAARKGYAPSVVCRDCGTTLRDELGRAYSLASVKGERILRTADGKNVQSAKQLCPLCGSWNLMPLGVGIERVVEELTAAFPDAALIRFDTDTVKTDAQARKAMKLYRDEGGILVGTESMLPWLNYGLHTDKTYDLAVVASMDSLLALPFWRARERFVRVGLILREHAARTLIHTRLPDDTALEAVLDPKGTSFFAEEAELRRALRYPPFGTLIAFHVEGAAKRLLEAKIILLEAVMPHAPTVLPERNVEKNTYRMTILLHLGKGEWPEEELSKRLQALPPYFRISIDPETFW